ncbi:hypothetical protein P691DRAFT_711260 [Macrolepiota fuliginosa MF-IS2]|uniref:Large ribosomal subunit protein mL59 domain-containing protein n=1 Tax=Macrolepiota fuliginosa MF-IS2 TaxID=1400762 RepID=A0A9P5X4T4_9AGAR|nr:hypothetical protein P691DRAFT_711260 [Macrolepiota fuliginosa MF-IS2]
MSNLVAAKAVKKFRVDQLLKVETHIRRLGPLSKEVTPKLQPKSNVAILPNPFIPRKHPETGKWRPPVYSLRRQAELVKKAKASGLLHLLPPGPKSPQTRLGVTEAIREAQKATTAASLDSLKEQLKAEEDQSVWLEPVAWEGKLKEKKTRGRDLGITLYAGKKRMFKGHKWERVQGERLRKRAILLRDMKKRIYNYKNYYKRRKPNPLKPPRTVKAPKLPF